MPDVTMIATGNERGFGCNDWTRFSGFLNGGFTHAILNAMPSSSRNVRPAFGPREGENRMQGAGDVHAARDRFYHEPTPNLKVVVGNRYGWMNRFIDPDTAGVEFGSGAGFAREFIRCRALLLTDCADYGWLDVKNVDALNPPFSNESFDFVISVNVIHHLAQPLRFFRQMQRILRPGGRLIIQDVRCSWLMRLALRLQRHEGYDFNVDVYDERVPCTNPDDPWAGNNAIVDLLLENETRFYSEFPEFRLIHRSYSECMTLLNSGGVIARTAYLPLPLPLVRLMGKFDQVITNALPDIFAFQVQLVLQKALSRSSPVR
jgi:SAM-dependent methyltransferase